MSRAADEGGRIDDNSTATLVAAGFAALSPSPSSARRTYAPLVPLPSFSVRSTSGTVVGVIGLSSVMPYGQQICTINEAIIMPPWQLSITTI